MLEKYKNTVEIAITHTHTNTVLNHVETVCFPFCNAKSANKPPESHILASNNFNFPHYFKLPDGFAPAHTRSLAGSAHSVKSKYLICHCLLRPFACDEFFCSVNSASSRLFVWVSERPALPPSHSSFFPAVKTKPVPSGSWRGEVKNTLNLRWCAEKITQKWHFFATVPFRAPWKSLTAGWILTLVLSANNCFD